MAVSGRPKPDICFFSGGLEWTFLPKERYDDSLSGHGSMNVRRGPSQK